MILLYLIVILLGSGIIAGIVGTRFPLAARLLALAAVMADAILLIIAYATGNNSGNGGWIMAYYSAWIPSFGINLHLSLDGLSLLMLGLTYFLGFIAVVISWKEITKNPGFFHFNLLWILAGISGVFLSMDLFLFYFFWEIMLVPMYFLINVWGHEKKIYASYKFFIFTQASGLLMFIAIIALYLYHGSISGIYTFDYQQLLGTQFSPLAGSLIMGGFLIAFLVKLPVVPFHNWLPDAHSEAPTAGSLILAGLMLKTGAYGLLRFIVPLFPHEAANFGIVGMLIGVAGILYGAKLAFAQTDLKRLVAYTSVSHMGFIMLGVFSFNALAYNGVIMQILAHGISTGALFVIAGQLQERLHSRDLSRMGGLWEQTPFLGSMGLIFAMASLGLPGMGNFVAEFITLLGSFKTNAVIASLASLGLIAGTLYSLRIMQKIFYGPRADQQKVIDLSIRERLVMAAMTIAILFLGLFPQTVFDLAKPSIGKTLEASRDQGSGSVFNVGATIERSNLNNKITPEP